MASKDKNTQVIEDFSTLIPFEPMYEYVKTDRNAVWFYYEDKIEKLIKWLGYWKNFNKDELKQQAFIYFCGLCDQYDPLYDNKFYKFDRYLFKNLIMKLRAYIQRYYFKGTREKPSEYCEFLLQSQTTNPIQQKNSEMYVYTLLKLLPDKQQEVVELTLQGYKQQEIGKRMDISQSRVSVIKKKAFKELQFLVDDTFTDEEKRQMRLDDLKKYYLGE